MNLDFCVNEYLLAWYLLYSASLSKEIDKFRKNLWNKYKKEYNLCYKDKTEIIKYGKDFIPDNDILYNEIFESDLYTSLKKETEKHRMYLVKIFNNDFKTIKKYTKEIIRIKLNNVYNVFVIHPRMEIIEYNRQFDALIWGSDKDKYDSLTIMFLTITKNIFNDKIKENQKGICKEIENAVIELAIINEIGKRLTNQTAYELGDPTLKVIKRQIYPFWLMYLGYDTKEALLNRMIEDKIVFDADKYSIDKNMKKMDLGELINFCIKNNKYILKLGNVLEIEKENEIEVI